ncbi:auxin efflux carrier [Peziza echinospora]|nr:auxin efflux carrier [Peziza echinospora]
MPFYDLYGLTSTPTSFARSSIPHSNALFSSGNGALSFSNISARSDGSQHPALGSLIFLVFEAVLEVVCVSLPGYIIARQGMFTPEMQKFVAHLNVSLFTPCLIFTKLASQLTLSKIAELAVIPVIFVVMTFTSYFCALAMCRILKLGKRARNFVIAMGVFGNSNSLPISLVVSLSATIGGLHWDRIPGDNDGEVAARGILYLLIFQQLGQLVRWSWGYHVLLAPPGKYDELDDGSLPADPRRRYRDFPEEDESSDEDDDIERQIGVDPFMSPQFENSFVGLQAPQQQQHTIDSVAAGPTRPSADLLQVAKPHSRHHSRRSTARHSTTGYSETHSEAPTRSQSPNPFEDSSTTSISSRPTSPDAVVTISALPTSTNPAPPPGSFPVRAWRVFVKTTTKVYTTFMAVMNPPLWAMLAAVIVASIPKLQAVFFTPGTFIQGSVTRAVAQCGNVAVPLILVVLGANLGHSTTAKGGAAATAADKRASKHDTKLLFASLMSRMLLPYVFTAPLLALAAKYVPISILDDPIFVVVCFLLVGAPSALQLAQICQINGVYESVMARILFWSYVVVILPSTLVLVITAIEVVKWAA